MIEIERRIITTDDDGAIYLVPVDKIERFDALLDIIATADQEVVTHRDIGQIFPWDIAAQQFADEMFQYGYGYPPIEIRVCFGEEGEG